MVFLINTDVITFVKDGIILNSGGWRTPTTKDRINSFCNARIYQKNHIWYMRDGSKFFDGIKINSEGYPIGEIKTVDLEKVRREKKQIAKFVALITKDNLPTPNNGDCWYCLMKTNEGKTLGDSFNDSSHLVEHLKEGYLHGSLLVNAMREKGYQDHQIGLHYSMKLADTFKRAVRQYLTKRLVSV